MNNRLLILTPLVADYEQLVRQANLPKLEIVTARNLDEARQRGLGCNIVLGSSSLISALLAELPRLTWVHSTWAGVEALLQPGLRRDYLLTNTRAVFGPLISEYVFCYLLMAERQALQRLEKQRQGIWDETRPGTVRGKCMGIVGVGSIGAHLAQTAKHFGLRTKGFTASSRDCPFIDHYAHSDLPAFAADVDYLVVTLPNTNASRHLIDAAVLRALPRHALLINVGRGACVDEAALATALQQELFAGAVLDVFETEPLPAESPLWRLPNVVITSHTAALSFAADVAPGFIENYRRFVAGEPLQHLVDFERGY